VKRQAANEDLDLHGYTVAEALARFVEQYNRRVAASQFCCWRVIHGYGSTGTGGAIRLRLRAFLEAHRDKLRYEPGDDYGDPGWTWVYPRHPLPSLQDQLATAILAFCSVPRSEGRILREFVRSAGDVATKRSLRTLVELGRLKVTPQGTQPLYEPVE
jgi:hypothetical protein